MSRKKICPNCGKLINSDSFCECRKKDKNEYMKQYQQNNSGDPIKSRRWKKFREHILERDNHLCQRCLLKYHVLNSNDLQAHHIKSRRDFPELTFDKNNVLTLCKTCNLQLGTSNKLDFELRQEMSADTGYNL